MGKLIDADEFVEWLMSDAITDEQRKFAEQVKYAADRMKLMDAVPVVRCKDCINCITKHGRPWCELWSGDTALLGFCNFERKDGDHAEGTV